MYWIQSQSRFPVNCTEITIKALMSGRMVSLPTLSDNVWRTNQLRSIGSCSMDLLMLFGLSRWTLCWMITRSCVWTVDRFSLWLLTWQWCSKFKIWQWLLLLPWVVVVWCTLNHKRWELKCCLTVGLSRFQTTSETQRRFFQSWRTWLHNLSNQYWDNCDCSWRKWLRQWTTTCVSHWWGFWNHFSCLTLKLK